MRLKRDIIVHSRQLFAEYGVRVNEMMLVRLELENFHSVSERASFDLRIGKTTPENTDRFLAVPSTASVRVPKVAMIYGPNASGKSTILRALTFFNDLISRSFQYEIDESLPFRCFQRKDFKTKSSKFRYEFAGKLADKLPDSLFVYDLEVRNEDDGVSYIVAEKLRYYAGSRSKNLFQRYANEVKYYPSFDVPKALNAVEFRRNASVLSTLVQYNHKMSIDLVESLSDIFANLFYHRQSSNDDDLRITAKRYSDLPGLIDVLSENIRRVDLGISQVTLHRIDDSWTFLFEHKGLDFNSAGYMESQGTKSFIRLFVHLQMALSIGGIAVIDELDGDLHPLIVPEIIDWFHSPTLNPLGAQLIATVHNASIMNHLEKEEVFFTEKDDAGSTSIFSLQDVDVRRGADFASKYLLGVFGAVPRVG